MNGSKRLLTSIILAAGTHAAWGQEKPVHFALTKGVFRVFSAEDVIPQAQLIADKVGREIGRPVLIAKRGYELPDVIEELRSGKLHFVLGGGIDFVRLKSGKFSRGVTEKPIDVRPVAAVATPGEKTVGRYRALILVRRGSNINSMADLKGKRFAYSPLAEAGLLLVEKLVRKQGYGSLNEFFGRMRRMTVEDCCLIALQHGGADVTCVADYILGAKELLGQNAQRTMKRLDQSPLYVAWVCFYRQGNVSDKLVEQMREQLLDLHHTPEGVKLLQNCRVSRFAPVELKDLMGLEELLQ